MKALLLIAFHYPPYGAGSGVHRASKFARYLPEKGWQPHILTASIRAYERVSSNVQPDLKPKVRVTRAFALDSQRHLGIRGLHFRWSALPDRWATWILGAVPAGLSILLRRHIDVIMVTFPIATAVLIGWLLQQVSGKPLVVDFRDSMTEEGYPRDALTRGIHRWIERKIIHSGSRFIFTAKSARDMYLKRYPQLSPSRCVIIPNGYDEEDFTQSATSLTVVPKSSGRQLRLLHTGLLYPDDRDPRAFLRAVKRIKDLGGITARELRVDWRGAGWTEYYTQLLKECEVDDIVHVLPEVPHSEALREAGEADALLLFQAASCDHQIPAKVYEYLRLGKPILALTSMTGDTAALLVELGGATIVNLTNEDEIVQALERFLDAVRRESHSRPDPRKVGKLTRKEGALSLAGFLDELLTPVNTTRSRVFSHGQPVANERTRE